MPALAQAAEMIFSARGHMIPDMPTGAQPNGRGYFRPRNSVERSGVNGPSRIDGMRWMSFSDAMLRRC